MQNTVQEFKVGDKVKYKDANEARLNNHNPDMIYTIDEIIFNYCGYGAPAVSFHGSVCKPWLSQLQLAEQPQKHIHHDLIIAWAKDPKGCIIQWYDPNLVKWRCCIENKPSWCDELTYRIKPKTNIKKYKYSLSYTGNGILHTADHYSDEEWQQRLKENPTKFFTRLEWTEKEFEEV